MFAGVFKTERMIAASGPIPDLAPFTFVAWIVHLFLLDCLKFKKDRSLPVKVETIGMNDRS